jgi:lipopolysaccharide transport system permease protein
LILKQIFHYRYYLLRNTWITLRYRYAGTGFGALWNIGDPLFQLLVYTFIFSNLAIFRSGGGGKGAEYTLFLCSGLIPFISFSESINSGSNSIIRNAIYLRHSDIPAEFFVIINSLGSAITLVIYYLLFIPISLLFGNRLSIEMLWIPVIIILMHAMTLGISIILADLRILFPDLGEIINVFLQLLRWTLPIFYTDANFPQTIRTVLHFNPPWFFLTSLRSVTIEHQLPPLQHWGYMLVWAVVLLGAGLWISQKLKSDIRDEL